MEKGMMAGALFVCLLFSAGMASAKLYVAKAANSNKSITIMLGKAKAGDTIEVQAGVYSDMANGGE